MVDPNVMGLPSARQPWSPMLTGWSPSPTRPLSLILCGLSSKPILITPLRPGTSQGIYSSRSYFFKVFTLYDRFDLWEEVSSSSYFTSASQHRALREGAVLATRIDQTSVVPSYTKEANNVLCFLQVNIILSLVLFLILTNYILSHIGIHLKDSWLPIPVVDVQERTQTPLWLQCTTLTLRLDAIRSPSNPVPIRLCQAWKFTLMHSAPASTLSTQVLPLMLLSPQVATLRMFTIMET